MRGPHSVDAAPGPLMPKSKPNGFYDRPEVRDVLVRRKRGQIGRREAAAALGINLNQLDLAVTRFIPVPSDQLSPPSPNTDPMPATLEDAAREAIEMLVGIIRGNYAGETKIKAAQALIGANKAVKGKAAEGAKPAKSWEDVVRDVRGETPLPAPRDKESGTDD